MANLQRYDLNPHSYDGEVAEMEPHPDGDWVRHEDATAQVARLTEGLRRHGLHDVVPDDMLRAGMPVHNPQLCALCREFPEAAR